MFCFVITGLGATLMRNSPAFSAYFGIHLQCLISIFIFDCCTRELYIYIFILSITYLFSRIQWDHENASCQRRTKDHRVGKFPVINKWMNEFQFLNSKSLTQGPSLGAVLIKEPWKYLVSGGVGGFLYWFLTYPADVVKVTGQTDLFIPYLYYCERERERNQTY